MYTSHSTGIKIVDFIDMYDPEIDIYNEVINFTKDFLNSSKRVFFIDDDAVFNKFCELFALTFYSRTMNFNTTLDFKMKLDQLLLYNQMKYKKIFDASLIEIDPLLTYYHEINHEEEAAGTNGENTSTSESFTNSTENDSKDTYNDVKDKTSYNQYKDEKSFENRKDEGKDHFTHGLVTDTENKELVSNTPQSNVAADDLFTNNTFVSGVKHDINNVTNSGTDLTTSEIEYQGKEINEKKGSYDTTRTGSVDTNASGSATGSNEQTGKKSGEFANSRIFTEISKGYDGAGIDLLNKYVSIVFDVCKTIIDDIEVAHLFSEIL